MVSHCENLDVGGESWRSGTPAIQYVRELPLRVATWKSDSTCPVKKRGHATEAGENWSLDIDINITRRTLRSARHDRRAGFHGFAAQHSSRGALPSDRPHSTPLMCSRSLTPGLPSLNSARASPSSLPCSSPLPMPQCTPPIPTNDRLQGFPSSARRNGDRRCNSAMGMSRRTPYPRSRSEVSRASTVGSDYASDGRTSVGSVSSLGRMTAGVGGQTLIASRGKQGDADAKESDSWFPMRRHSAASSESSTASASPSPPRGRQPPRERSELVRWCFRRKREVIEGRLAVLDRCEFSEEHRNLAYVQREDDPDDDAEIGQILDLFTQLGLQSLPPTGHPAALECWNMREGGSSRTSEILTAFEVLNFYRWLCGVPRLRLDSFQQTLADLLLQVLTKRDPRVNMSPEGVPDLYKFFEGVAHYVSNGKGRALVVSHIPTASAAMRLMFTGLPERSSPATRSTERGAATAQATFGADLPAVEIGLAEDIRLHLPLAAEAAVRDYLPLLRLACHEEQAGASSAEADPSAKHKATTSMQGPRAGVAVVAKTARTRQSQAMMRDSHVAEPRNLAASASGSVMGSTAQQKRRSRAWGDVRGVVAFRRSALDPRLRSTGLLRLGCRTCLWVDTNVEGEPDELPEGYKKSVAGGFLDPEVMEESGKGDASWQLKALHRWREEMSRRLTCGEFPNQAGIMPPMADVASRGAENVVVGGEAATFFEQEQRESIIGGQHAEIAAQRRTRGIHSSALENQTDDIEEAPKDYEDFVDHRILYEQSSSFGVDDEEFPLMVCFPPPGIIPFEEISDSSHFFWTISPDPHRLAPTPSCGVQVYRVHIDVDQGRADRIEEEVVPLDSFRVDCANIGTHFCIMFSLAVGIGAGDQFEVVLSGLAGPLQSSYPVADLRYFVSFESFRPSVLDTCHLQRRAKDLIKTFQTDHIWQQPFMYVPGEAPGEEEFLSIVSLGRSARAKKAAKTSSVSESIPTSSFGDTGRPKRFAERKTSQEQMAQPQDSLKAVPRALLKMSTGAARASEYSPKSPPPIGIVSHPEGSMQGQPAMYTIDAAFDNEIELALLVPSTVLIKASLVAFVKSSAKWEPLPYAVFMTYLKEEVPDEVGSTQDAPSLVTQSKHQNLSSFQPPPPQRHRVLLRVMLPAICRYELCFNWGFTPSDALQWRNTAVVAPHDHPLKIALVMAPKVPGFRALVPSFFHATARHLGYPLKHALAEHCGITLVGPMRYRLRIGYVRFAVHVNQGEPALSEAKAIVAGTVAAAVEQAEPNLSNENDATVYEASLVSAPHSVSATSYCATRLEGASRTTRPSTLATSLAPSGDKMHTSKSEVHVHFEEAEIYKDISDDSDDNRDKEGEESESNRLNEPAEAATKEVLLEDIQRRVKRQLSRQLRRGTSGQVCVVAVVGAWRRVELLRRRPLEPPSAPSGITALAGTEGSAVAAAAAAAAVAAETEVHEAVVHLTDEDQSQPVQLIAFQIGAADALDSLTVGLSQSAVESEGAVSKRRSAYGGETGTRRRGPADYTRAVFPSSSFAATTNGEQRIAQRVANGPPVRLGQMIPPSRWCVAEFIVEGSSPLPYDEDEMEKPLPAPRDPIEMLNMEAREERSML